jgi:uncharacterized protein (TIGR02270 family)
MTTSMKTQTILPIIRQYAEETPFLWRLRDLAISGPHYNLTELTRLDHRIEAHIDGLRIAGNEGWVSARKEMAWKAPGEIFSAAVLAYESNDRARIDAVQHMGTNTLELESGVISALGWMDYALAARHIRELCDAASSAHRRIGVAASAVHRQDPGPVLQDALRSSDARLRARAARAVGELGRIELLRLLEQIFDADDPACRFWSAWSVALLDGYSKSIQILESIAAALGPYSERALQVAMRRLKLTAAHAWNEQLSADFRTLRLAVIGAGIIGDPLLIPWLIERMKLKPLARVAGEAFTMITGVDLAYHDLDTKCPDDVNSGPNEDPKDENVQMDPDERLPWPNATLVANWFGQHHSEFQGGSRHLLGKPISAEWMREVLKIGRQRQRAAAAIELAMTEPSTPLFEVRAPGFRQLEILRRLTAS